MTTAVEGLDLLTDPIIRTVGVVRFTLHNLEPHADFEAQTWRVVIEDLVLHGIRGHAVSRTKALHILDELWLEYFDNFTEAASWLSQACGHQIAAIGS